MQSYSDEIYLTKMEVLEFFRMSNEDFIDFIKDRLLNPSTRDGKIKYVLSNIMGCMSLLIAWEKTEF